MKPYLHHAPHPTAPVVVILPGVNSGPYLFEGAVAALGDTHRLIIANPPGCGGTPMPMPLTAETYARTVLALLDDMQVEGSFSLLGHSLGSFAAQELARVAPERVERLILASTSIGQPYMARDTLAIRGVTGMSFWDLSRAIAKDPATHMKHFFGPAFPVQNAQAYLDFIAKRQANLAPKQVTVAQFAAGGAFSSYRWAHNLTPPTLVVQGGADILTPASSARKLAQFIPNARYLEFYGVGHFPMLEHEGFYPSIKRFLLGHAEGEVLDDHVGVWEKLQRSWLRLHG
ncbi:MAG: alpha/beta hydrolase [Alphaproteobacteria bacterium]